MASKQRRPGTGAATDGPTSRPAGPESSPDAAQAHDAEVLRSTPEAAARAGGLSGAQNPVAERVALALSVAPRAVADTQHLIGLVERSALSGERKTELRERLEADQAAADGVSAVVREAFGADGPELRAALLEGVRGAADASLVEAVAAATGHPESAVRSLCDGLSGWVGWWWDEEEEETAAPGDYAAEESGA